LTSQVVAVAPGKEGVALLVTYSFSLCVVVFLAAGLKK
jgi:hypothetical protein